MRWNVECLWMLNQDAEIFFWSMPTPGYIYCTEYIYTIWKPEPCMHTKVWKKQVARGRKKKSLFLKDISLCRNKNRHIFCSIQKCLLKKDSHACKTNFIIQYFIIAYRACEIGCHAEDSSFLLNCTSKWKYLLGNVEAGQWFYYIDLCSTHMQWSIHITCSSQKSRETIPLKINMHQYTEPYSQ